MEEIKNALKNMKNGKVAGCHIPPEARKEGGLLSAKNLHFLLKNIWIAETVPQDWKLCLLVKLPKKGDLTLQELEGHHAPEMCQQDTRQDHPGKDEGCS